MTSFHYAFTTMPAQRDNDIEKAQRFRLAALPYLDDVYTVARYLLSNPADAEDAAQECYLRALRHFDTFRGGPIKPWLLTILRNVCRAEYARRSALAASTTTDLDACEDHIDSGWKNDRTDTPESLVLRHLDGEKIKQLIAQLPHQFREVFVLHEVNELSYRQIADAIGAPVGTVMSRLARARALLRNAWTAEEEEEAIP
jgi:RNA polymerase sigma-70 factor (ECF subfamily)